MLLITEFYEEDNNLKNLLYDDLFINSSLKKISNFRNPNYK